MQETSLSLLERLREPVDNLAWDRLIHLYTPIIRRWLLRSRLQAADVDDVVQDILGVLVRRLPDFEHDGRTGSFRVWLRIITTNRLRDFWRARSGRPRATGDSDFLEVLQQIEDPAGGLSVLWDQEHDRYVLLRLLELIEPEFQASTMQAARLQLVEGRPVDEVAATVGISTNAVIIAKSRVLRRLREESRGLVDEEATL